MSTILKALRRLEQEKERQAAADRLHGEVISPAAPLQRGGRRRWLLGAIGLAAAGVLTAALYPSSPLELPVEPSPQSADAVTAPRTGRGRSATAFVPDAAGRVSRARREIAREASAVPAAPPPSVGRSRETPAPTPTPRAVSAAPPPSPARSPEAVVASAARPWEVRVEPDAARGVAGGAVDPTPRVRMPEVSVVRTVWHPIRERRVVDLVVGSNAERIRLHEGDAYGALVVAEITPSGVVFEHAGVRISQRVGHGR